MLLPGHAHKQNSPWRQPLNLDPPQNFATIRRPCFPLHGPHVRDEDECEESTDAIGKSVILIRDPQLAYDSCVFLIFPVVYA